MAYALFRDYLRLTLEAPETTRASLSVANGLATLVADIAKREVFRLFRRQ